MGALMIGQPDTFPDRLSHLCQIAKTAIQAILQLKDAIHPFS
jgi:hypothetical protein